MTLEQLKKHCWVDERGDHQMPVDEAQVLITEAHHEGFQLGFKDGHAEAVEEIIKIAESMKQSDISHGHPLNNERTCDVCGWNSALTDLIEAIKKKLCMKYRFTFTTEHIEFFPSIFMWRRPDFGIALGWLFWTIEFRG
jgi:hypothetical protein